MRRGWVGPLIGNALERLVVELDPAVDGTYPRAVGQSAIGDESAVAGPQPLANPALVALQVELPVAEPQGDGGPGARVAAFQPPRLDRKSVV